MTKATAIPVSRMTLALGMSLLSSDWRVTTSGPAVPAAAPGSGVAWSLGVFSRSAVVLEPEPL